jgi:ABC-2 type transport system ATP-binding protein
MREIIVRQAKRGTAIILSSHLLTLVEEVCSHLLVLKGGQSIFSGTMAQVRAEHPDAANLEDIFVTMAEAPLAER